MLRLIGFLFITAFLIQLCHASPLQFPDHVRGDLKRRPDSTDLRSSPSSQTVIIDPAIPLQLGIDEENQQNGNIQTKLIVKRAVDTSEVTSQTSGSSPQTSIQSPPTLVQSPQTPVQTPVTSTQVQPPQVPSQGNLATSGIPTTTQVQPPLTANQSNPTTSGIAGALANVVNQGLDAADQFAAVGDRISQRIKSRLNRFQSGVDTMVDTKLNAYGDLFKSVASTGVKFPTTAMRLGFAAVKLPLDVVG